MQVQKINNNYRSSNSITFKKIIRNDIPANVLKDNYLLIVSGPSGVGKDTIMNSVIDKFNKIVTTTTRPKREGEIDGVNYFFTTVEKFVNGIKNNEFAEYIEGFSGRYYGTKKETIKNALKGDKPGLLVIDVDGAKSIRESFKDDPKVNVVSIFFKPPSTNKMSPLEVLRSRLVGRGTETPEAIQERLDRSITEMKRANEYDAEIAFESLDEGINDLKTLLNLSI